MGGIMNLNEFIWGLVGFLLTVMVLSYLIADNIFFRLASSLFVGLTAGYLTILIINEILRPYLWTPLVSGSWTARAIILIPILLIALLCLGQFSGFSKLGGIPLAYLAGLAAALTIGGAVFGTLIPQITAIVNYFNLQAWWTAGSGAWVLILDAIVMLIGAITTLTYFHFGRKKNSHAQEDAVRRPKFIEGMSNIGQVFIGITLGAIFAGVFSSALFALINRIAFIGQFVAQWFGGN
jgi:hypothetical protein